MWLGWCPNSSPESLAWSQEMASSGYLFLIAKSPRRFPCTMFLPDFEMHPFSNSPLQLTSTYECIHTMFSFLGKVGHLQEGEDCELDIPRGLLYSSRSMDYTTLHPRAPQPYISIIEQ